VVSAIFTGDERALLPLVTGAPVVIATERAPLVVYPAHDDQGLTARASGRSTVVSGGSDGVIVTAAGARRAAGGLELYDLIGRPVAHVAAAGPSIGSDPDAPVLSVQPSSSDLGDLVISSSVPSELVLTPQSAAVIPSPILPLVCQTPTPSDPPDAEPAPGSFGISHSPAEDDVAASASRAAPRSCSHVTYRPFLTQTDRQLPLANGRSTISCPPDTGVYYANILSELLSGDLGTAEPRGSSFGTSGIDIGFRGRSAVATARARCRGGRRGHWITFSTATAFSYLQPYVRTDPDAKQRDFSNCR
jgi:hypothetical protein